MTNQLAKYQSELKTELVSILNYWIKNTIDKDNGGFYGKIDHFNKIDYQAHKGAVLNARILWTFSAAYNLLKNEAYLQVADRSYNYIQKFFIDKKFGGLVWEVDCKGDPVNARKQIYAQGFGIYGFSEYFKASENPESLETAKSLFREIELHSYDSVNGGYLEALDQKWNNLDDMRLSEKDANYPKSMNTHLHILEPYTNLYRVWKNDELAKKIRSLMQTFLGFIIDTNTFHFNLFFENDWQVRSNIVSYGHDIEGAWLLTEAAEALGDEALLKEVQNVVVRMTNATVNEGMDKDCSLYYEYDSKSGHLDSDKHWWPQAEAMIGLINAFQITMDENYLSKSLETWKFIKDRMIDDINGEWYWRVDAMGKPIQSEDKAGFWKCPYHNSRACMEGINRLNSILS